MEILKQYNKLEEWINFLLSQGKYAFPLHQARTAFPEQTDTAIKFALKRLVDKKRILSIHKGYYLIITPQYSAKGILPPTLFLDAFMKELKRPYYMGLLSAAAYHGASHQQAQEFFVVTGFPVMRPLLKKGLKINFISVSHIPSFLIEIRKTETGYMNISNAVLTAVDLIHYSKRVGGLNRVATLLEELAENIKPSDFDSNLIQHLPITAMQRLGYILENVIEQTILSDALFLALENHEVILFRIPLKSTAPTTGFKANNRWKVIVNTVIEIDE